MLDQFYSFYPRVSKPQKYLMKNNRGRDIEGG